jgi:hypothetical protein
MVIVGALICVIYNQTLICQPIFVINRVVILYVPETGNLTTSSEYIGD